MTEPYGHLGITGRYPTIAHVSMAEEALKHFAKVIVMPCAQVRVDKAIEISSWDRWNMTYEAFRDLKDKYPKRLIISNAIVHSRKDITTLQQINLLKERDLRRHGNFNYREYYIIVGSDNVLPVPGNPNLSKVEASWVDGKEAWNAPWAIYQRDGTLDLSTIRLPRRHIVIKAELPNISSTKVLEMIKNGDPNWKNFVPPREVQYILKHGLDK